MKHELRRRYRSQHDKPVQTPSFSIDVGSRTPLIIEIEGVREYYLLSHTDAKVAIKIVFQDNSPEEVLIVRWSADSADVRCKSNISMMMGADTKCVPRVLAVETLNHEKVVVYVERRRYISGIPLSRILGTMTPEEIDAVQMQVQVIVWQLSCKVSPYFGHIRDGELRTTSAPAYMRLRMLMDVVAGRIPPDTYNTPANDAYVGRAVFCHGSLIPEHIIVDGINVVGIVGWSQADFVPELFDRLKYYFMSDPRRPVCWYKGMANMPVGIQTPPPTVEFALTVAEYAHKSAWCSADVRNRARINQLKSSLQSNPLYLNCMSRVVERSCDTMSLSSLTSWNTSTTRRIEISEE